LVFDIPPCFCSILRFKIGIGLYLRLHSNLSIGLGPLYSAKLALSRPGLVPKHSVDKGAFQADPGGSLDHIKLPDICHEFPGPHGSMR
jgi:hypothetical protein